jgi:hypothetical protein
MLVGVSNVNKMRVVVLAFSGQDMDLRGADSASIDHFYFHAGIHSKRTYGLAKQVGIDTRMHERAQHHVSTDTRKAVEICNRHIFLPVLSASPASQIVNRQ